MTEIQMKSGEYVRPYEPWTFTPRIDDIAHHLAGIYRFNGLTRLTVAQHSVIVADHVPEDAQLWALLHDAPEAYLGDMAAPLKHAVGIHAAQRRAYEAALMNRICEVFGLPTEEPSSVRSVDARAAVTERRDLLPDDPRWMFRDGWVAYADVPPFEERIVPWSARQARAAFLARFDVLSLGVAA